MALVHAQEALGRGAGEDEVAQVEVGRERRHERRRTPNRRTPRPRRAPNTRPTPGAASVPGDDTGRSRTAQWPRPGTGGGGAIPAAAIAPAGPPAAPGGRCQEAAPRRPG